MPLDPDRIQAICFDVDGTLRDTDDQLVQKLSELLKGVSFLFPKGDRQKFSRALVMALENPGNDLQELADRLNIDRLLSRLFDRVPGSRSSQLGSAPLLIQGVREMLAELSRTYSLAIVSSRSQRVTQSFLEQADLLQFFRAMATSQTCKYTKPHPDSILWAAKQMGVPAQSCLMVGDTTVDIRAGRAAGSQTVGVLCGFGEELELQKAGADLILTSTALLHQVLSHG